MVWLFTRFKPLCHPTTSNTNLPRPFWILHSWAVFSRLNTHQRKDKLKSDWIPVGVTRNDIKLFPFVISIFHNDDIENPEVSQWIFKLKATLYLFAETKTFCLSSRNISQSHRQNTHKQTKPKHSRPLRGTKAGTVPGGGTWILTSGESCSGNPQLHPAPQSYDKRDSESPPP